MTDTQEPTKEERDLAKKRKQKRKRQRLTHDAAAKDCLLGLALADHMGDVNDYLPKLATLLGQPAPEWDDAKHRMVFPWEPEGED